MLNNDNIDNLFRSRLANKEMKVSNPNFSFKQQGSSGSSYNAITKVVKILKTYKIIAIVTSSVVVGSIFYFVKNQSANDNKNTTITIDSLPQEKDVILLKDNIKNEDTSAVISIENVSVEQEESVELPKTLDNVKNDLPDEEIKQPLIEHENDMNNTEIDSMVENINNLVQDNVIDSVETLNVNSDTALVDKPASIVDTDVDDETLETEVKEQPIDKKEERKKKREVKKLR